MKKIIFALILGMFLFNSGFASADVISLNSGGSGNVVVNPDTYIEGFFSGIPVKAVVPVCGNGILEAGEECDDGNLINGDGCSSSCTIEAGGGGGGGGGGAGGISISVSPTEINLNLAVNTNQEQKVLVTNTGANTATVTVSQTGLNKMVILPDDVSFSLSAGETKEITFIFVALSEEGIFTGRLTIGGKQIPVSLNVKSKLLLFDSNIIVLNEDYLVHRGDKLRTAVTLIPLGDKERMDVTLNYVIKDYDDRVYLTRTETVLIEEQVNFRRNFDTGILPLGQYIVGLELVYPNGVAPSSAHFEVIQARTNTFFGKLVLFLVNAILIILILIIGIIVSRMIKQIKANQELERKGIKILGEKARKEKQK